MSQGDWGKGGNPHMRIIAEDRDVIYSRQKSLKQTKHAEAGFNIRILQNSKIIQVVKNHKRSSCPTHHSKQGKPKGFCPEGLLYLQRTFQLNYFVLRPPLVRLTAQCYSNSFNLFNKEPGVHCQLRDWNCICFCLLLPAHLTRQRRKTGRTSIHTRSNTCTSAME